MWSRIVEKAKTVGVSVVRTVAPPLVAVVLVEAAPVFEWLESWGVFVDREILGPRLVLVFTAVYYSAIRWVEEDHAKAGLALVIPRKPHYDESSSA